MLIRSDELPDDCIIGWDAIGAIFGVTGRATRRWAKRANVSLPVLNNHGVVLPRAHLYVFWLRCCRHAGPTSTMIMASAGFRLIVYIRARNGLVDQ